MEFGILGPLVIRDESGALAVRAAKQRVLLATLLVRAGRVVSVDSLVETLWDGRPPTSAVPSLRNYVLRLRACLGEAGHRIGFRDRGYVIEIAEDEVDLLRFGRLSEEGAAAFDRGQFVLAGRLLGRALKQWRGPALVDVESDALHREECPHLAESRLDVVELRLEAEFRAVGRVPWTAELRDLAREHPERERLWEHLICSLHGNGRRTEALAEYRQMERTLEQEYGVRPGERLRALHGRIHSGGEAAGSAPGAIVVSEHAPPVAAPAPRAAPTTTAMPAIPAGTAMPAASTASFVVVGTLPGVVPFQIPAAPADLTGRDLEAAQLVARLTDGTAGDGATTVLSGPPGIGKTALALHVAHAVRGAFPGGVLYADLRASGGKPTRAADVLASFLGALGVPGHTLPSGLDDRSALLRSLLAERRALLVLDDAEDGTQVRALLPGPGAGAALITARTRLDELCGAAHFEPGALAADASARLIAAIAGRARTAAEPRPVAELVRVCEGLPLALRVVGARLAARPSRSVRWLADRLADPDTLLDELRVGGLDVRTGLAEVCRRLEPDQARAFRALAAAGRPSVSVSDAARLLEVPPRQAERLLERLVDRYLLACGHAGHYVLGSLAGGYGRESARPDGGSETEPCFATTIG